MQKYQINTNNRLIHFLAQASHESCGFTVVYENLNYSAQGLLKVFPKYFNATTANQYARKPQAIANRVYANRMGNNATTDGYNYRGRGYIQLTGKDNYAALDSILPENILANPDLVATKYPLLSAAYYWNSRNLNSIADKGINEGINEEVIKAITIKINGGLNGLSDRIALTQKFQKLINA